MKVVLLPGWHERGNVMRTFIDGRHGRDGLAAFGFDCTIFPAGHDDLRARVERFGHFLDALALREPEAFPVATIGYSAGGLVNRGFLRAYPERAAQIAATIQVAAPNAGLISNYIANMLRLMWIPNRVVRDLDVASEYLTWLNRTSGHWEPTGRRGKERWVLDQPPWVAPEGHRILSIVGSVARYDRGESDGVIRVDSGSLQGAMPTSVLADPMANHLNLGAVWDIVALLGKGFGANDEIWTRVVDISARFLRGESIT